ncbi:MAG: AAA family ATPase [Exilibacterium sp.]
MSQRHREALAHLLYGINVAGGFVLLTGEVGTGKTTVSRRLLEQLPDTTDVAFILNPYLDATELLATMCDELGITNLENKRSLKYLNERLYHFLLENHAKGRNTVLLIDEAQHLQYEVLETVRLLTNLETNTKKLLQIIFVGQPELQKLLAKPSLRQLAQRITARFHIIPLNLAETEAYIAHRLRIAGLPANQQLFSLSIIKSLYSISGGVPRLINILCDRMLLGTYAQDKSVVDRATLKQAAIEVLGKDPDKTEVKSMLMPVVAASIAVLTLISLLWWHWSNNIGPALFDRELAESTFFSRDSTANNGTDIARLTEHTAPVSTENSEVLFSNESQALSELMQSLQLNRPSSPQACEIADESGLRCEHMAVLSWTEFKQVNRPSMLKLTTPANHTAYAVVVGIDNAVAHLSFNGKHQSMPLVQLGEMWNGEFTFFWNPPESFKHPISFGDRDPIVEWLAIKFAEMDGGFGIWSGEEYDKPLSERVKLFQRENNLKDDGVVGLKTLLKINDKLGVDRTLDMWYLAQN